ncbi:MAG: NAD-dependent epimerase/dehydratase family protein [Bacteroidetes bacterium]|nr:NAD-dependent epimerase/dehydratase family protein [Bacteroidota bacterium]
MKRKSIFLAGHRGMVGSAVLKHLQRNGYENVITRTRGELDLISQSQVDSFFAKELLDAVIICAAKVGGILANNTYRADFIYQNLQIASNLIHASSKYNVQKLINLGSSCIYPRGAKIPIVEESLLTDVLEKTNEPYAIAKIAAIKLCESYYEQYNNNFYSIMPCNMYGPRDNFDLKSSHVLPALIRKVHEAKESSAENVEVWGSGKPLREFLYVDDLAQAITYCLENVDVQDVYSKGISHINCGSEDEVSILELTHLIQKIVGYPGEIVFDSSKPDGTYRKKMDNTQLSNIGFTAKTSLEQGLKQTYAWYLENKQKFV